MTATLDLAARLALVKFITDGLTAQRKDVLVPDALAGWPSGTRMPVMFGGRHAGWASMPEGSTTAYVKDAAVLLAWAKVHQAGHVTDEVTVRVTPEVLAVLEEHLPGAIVRTPTVDPQWVTDVTAALKKQGYYVTREGEKLTEVPGIEVSTSDPWPRVNLSDRAAQVIGAAWAAGEIPVADLLALPASAEAGGEQA